jgi:hypothetical protein
MDKREKVPAKMNKNYYVTAAVKALSEGLEESSGLA